MNRLYSVPAALLVDPQRRWPYLGFVAAAAVVAALYVFSVSQGGFGEYLPPQQRFLPPLISAFCAAVIWPCLRRPEGALTWGLTSGIVTVALWVPLTLVVLMSISLVTDADNFSLAFGNALIGFFPIWIVVVIGTFLQLFISLVVLGFIGAVAASFSEQPDL